MIGDARWTITYLPWMMGDVRWMMPLRALDFPGYKDKPSII